MTPELDRGASDFLAEAEDIVEQLGQDLVDLSDCADTGECDPDLLNGVFRAAHSLKGLAGMFGFPRIAELAHTLENLLDALRLGKVPLDNQTVAVLFESLEVLASLVRQAGSGEGADIAAIVARISGCLSRTPAKTDDPAAGFELPERVVSALTEYEEHRLAENIRKGRSLYSIMASFPLASFDTDLNEVTDLLKNDGEVISTLPGACGDLSAGICFELLYGSDRSEEWLREMVGSDTVFVETIGRKGVTQAAAMPAAEPSAPAEPPAPAAPAPEEGSSRTASRTVRVDIGKLDELMNIVGELMLHHATLTSQIARSGATAAATLGMSKTSRMVERKLNELQKGVMDIRMIPVGNIYDKLSRMARKIAREQGKKINLKFFGAETELDKQIVEDISDPLMHIIRNAIDHGIEPPRERLAAGKEDVGTIRVAAYQKGNHVVIELADDGRGIDLERVKRKALEKGLVRSTEGMSEQEIIDLVFLPGFSTTENVSEISGRGVGMDVVKNNITALSGMVDIESTKGSGSRVTITLPITLAIIRALLVSVAGRTYGVPITSVIESLEVRETDVRTVERREMILMRESNLPLVRLDRFFRLPEAKRPDPFYVVVVGIAERRIGLVTDDLVGQQDIVIKSLGEMLAGLPGISGAAELGDQRTILVLDVAGIVQETTRSTA